MSLDATIENQFLHFLSICKNHYDLKIADMGSLPVHLEKLFLNQESSAYNCRFNENNNFNLNKNYKFELSEIYKKSFQMFFSINELKEDKEIVHLNNYLDCTACHDFLNKYGLICYNKDSGIVDPLFFPFWSHLSERQQRKIPFFKYFLQAYEQLFFHANKNDRDFDLIFIRDKRNSPIKVHYNEEGILSPSGWKVHLENKIRDKYKKFNKQENHLHLFDFVLNEIKIPIEDQINNFDIIYNKTSALNNSLVGNSLFLEDVDVLIDEMSIDLNLSDEDIEAKNNAEHLLKFNKENNEFFKEEDFKAFVRKEIFESKDLDKLKKEGILSSVKYLSFLKEISKIYDTNNRSFDENKAKKLILDFFYSGDIKEELKDYRYSFKRTLITKEEDLNLYFESVWKGEDARYLPVINKPEFEEEIQIISLVDFVTKVLPNSRNMYITLNSRLNERKEHPLIELILKPECNIFDFQKQYKVFEKEKDRIGFGTFTKTFVEQPLSIYDYTNKYSNCPLDISVQYGYSVFRQSKVGFFEPARVEQIVLSETLRNLSEVSNDKEDIINLVIDREHLLKNFGDKYKMDISDIINRNADVFINRGFLIPDIKEKTKTNGIFNTKVRYKLFNKKSSTDDIDNLDKMFETMHLQIPVSLNNIDKFIFSVDLPDETESNENASEENKKSSKLKNFIVRPQRFEKTEISNDKILQYCKNMSEIYKHRILQLFKNKILSIQFKQNDQYFNIIGLIFTKKNELVFSYYRNNAIVNRTVPVDYIFNTRYFDMEINEHNLIMLGIKPMTNEEEINKFVAEMMDKRSRFLDQANKIAVLEKKE